jgi:hypothetical protein
MKKILLIFSIITYCFSVNAQTLTTTATTVTSGTTVVVKAAGETPSQYLMGIQYWSKSVASPNSSMSGQVSVPAMTNFSWYNRAVGNPTTFQFNAVSAASIPLTVTYTFRVTPYDYVHLTSLPAVDRSITLTINPAPPNYNNWFTDWDNSMRYNGSDWSTTMTWNKDLVATGTVTIEVYQDGVFKGVVASNIPNTGTAFKDFTPYCELIGHTFYNITLRIISDANPSISDQSKTANMQVD